MTPAKLTREEAAELTRDASNLIRSVIQNELRIIALPALSINLCFLALEEGLTREATLEQIDKDWRRIEAEYKKRLIEKREQSH